MKNFALILVLIGFPLLAQPQITLFSNVQQQVNISPLPTVNSTYTLDVNFDQLKLEPDSILLNFPDGSSTTVNKTDFTPRNGYIFRDDEDPPGTPLYWVNPNAADSDMSYKWSGGNDDYDVLLTVNNGQLLGYISSSSKRYGIERLADNINYRMVDYYLEGFPGCHTIDTTASLDKNFAVNDEQKTTISHQKFFDLSKTPSANKSTQHTIIDALVVWTEEARIEAGGNPSDPNDTEDIDTLIITAIDHANQALSNSLSATRVTRFHTAKLNGFSLASGVVNNLNSFRELSSVNQLRNTVGADIVMGVIQTNTTLFNACGAAHVQTFPRCGIDDPNCGVGNGFNNYAYALVSQSCAIWDNTFTHEMGHLMGGNHTRISLGPSNVLLVTNNGFPEAFAWHYSSFKSIMTTEPSTLYRRLYFSNPNVSVGGTPTGSVGTAYNLSVIDSLTPTMSHFRTRPDLIFSNGFEQ